MNESPAPNKSLVGVIAIDYAVNFSQIDVAGAHWPSNPVLARQRTCLANPFDGGGVSGQIVRGIYLIGGLTQSLGFET